MSDGVLTWADLANRHEASHDLFVSCSIDYSFRVREDVEQTGAFAVWHGPQDRWRVEVSEQPVYVRTGDLAFALKKGTMQRQEPTARQFTVLQPVNPLWFFGPNSLLSRSGVLAPSASAIAAEVDGRSGWSFVADQVTLGARNTPGDGLEFVIDDKTGLVLRIGSVNGRLSGELRAVQVIEWLPDSLFEWSDEVVGPNGLDD
ncbi:hypothetical protein HYG77_17140 [Rhodococcus sp. ZPP]|uniref:hypothetical protein n=1 Tax=Rhodococcus sp. ZPP TaxID=2749906 RepID=UPI001AD85701|nr:hypothetical protein [Rhodococcus sp. ZPP]QTJ67139.1 hypothetical protein HYG77_17140 [Rhodococcus sp. ZPP]